MKEDKRKFNGRKPGSKNKVKGQIVGEVKKFASEKVNLDKYQSQNLENFLQRREGETFEDNIFPMASNGVHSRFVIKNIQTGALIGNHFVSQKMSKEDLEAHCKLLAADINNTVNAFL